MYYPIIHIYPPYNLLYQLHQKYCVQPGVILKHISRFEYSLQFVHLKHILFEFECSRLVRGESATAVAVKRMKN